MRSIPVVAVLMLAGAVFGSGCDSARPVAESNDTAAERCSGCHGFPPPPFVSTASSHPDSVACSQCHGTTVDESYNLVPGGTHLDGHVDFSAHAVPYVAQHTAEAVRDLNHLNACKECHGVDFAGGVSRVSCTACHQQLGFPDWQTNCTFCHGTRTRSFSVTPATLPLVAPPRGVHGETQTTQPAVGAHQKHLGNGSTLSDGVACGECHAVPANLSHLDGIARLAFGPLATQGGAAPAYAGGSCSATYCHGAFTGGANGTPSWTGSIASCTACHGSPPSTGQHGLGFHSGQPCSRCHVEVATETSSPGIQATPAARALHVNGTKNVSFSVSGTWDGGAKTCSNVACHGPPPTLRSW